MSNDPKSGPAWPAPRDPGTDSDFWSSDAPGPPGPPGLGQPELHAAGGDVGLGQRHGYVLAEGQVS